MNELKLKFSMQFKLLNIVEKSLSCGVQTSLTGHQTSCSRINILLENSPESNYRSLRYRQSSASDKTND